jgi:U3 small nucleolar RNA-associated protein 14
VSATPSEITNPWLNLSNSSFIKTSKKRVADSAGERVTKKLKKAASRTIDSVLEEDEDARVEINPDEVSRGLVKDHETKKDEGGEGEDRKKVRFKQRELVEEAFAGDDVVAVSIVLPWRDQI